MTKSSWILQRHCWEILCDISEVGEGDAASIKANYMQLGFLLVKKATLLIQEHILDFSLSVSVHFSHPGEIP